MRPALSFASSPALCRLVPGVLALLLLGSLALPAQAVDGLQLGATPRWQARLQATPDFVAGLDLDDLGEGNP